MFLFILDIDATLIETDEMTPKHLTLSEVIQITTG